jgi:hypothetical protein
MEKALHENRRKQMFAVPFESKKIMVTRIAESNPNGQGREERKGGNDLPR